MRIIFAGTPEFAAISLKELITAKHEVVAVYTQPDRTSGRNRKLSYSPVKQLAIEHNLPVEQPISFKDHKTIETFAAYKPDIFIVVAYGLILPQAILDIANYNLNLHASLLPKWRGASPIQAAILSGDLITGVTVMEIVNKLDAGPIVNTVSSAIKPTATSESLSSELSIIGSKVLISTLDNLLTLWPARTAQIDSYSSYAPKITKEMAEINWQRSATEIELKIRAFIPWPVAFTKINGTILKIYSAKQTQTSNLRPGEILVKDRQILIGTASNDLSIIELQLPNKSRMNAQAILCGYSTLFKGFCDYNQ